MTRLYYKWRHVESGKEGERHQDFPSKSDALDVIISWNNANEYWIYSPIRTEQV
jgi:hypothetical protein